MSRSAVVPRKVGAEDGVVPAVGDEVPGAVPGDAVPAGEVGVPGVAGEVEAGGLAGPPEGASPDTLTGSSARSAANSSSAAGCRSWSRLWSAAYGSRGAVRKR